jgi:uncharacterized protein (TIGR02266 family)
LEEFAVAAIQMESWSGTFECEMDEIALARGEHEAAEREKALSGEATQVDFATAAIRAQVDRLRARAATLSNAPQGASLQAELCTLNVVPIRKPAASAKAIEARTAALRARHAAHDALEQEIARRGRGLMDLSAAVNQIEKRVAESETWVARAAAERAAAEKKAAAKHEMERVFAKLAEAESSNRSPPARSPTPKPIPLTAPVKPPLPPPEERRAHRRVGIETEVSMESDSNFFAGFAEDISAGGLFVATHAYLPIGASLDISFRLANRRIDAAAVVRWVREVDDKNPEMIPGMGVQFTALPPGAREAIESFVAQREPMFYED